MEELMVDFGVAVIMVVWLVFSFFWFKIQIDGDFLDKIFLYIGISMAIFFGGAVIFALMATSPSLMIIGIMLITVFIVSCVAQSDSFKSRQTMKGVKKYEDVQQASTEELLNRLSGVEKGQVIRFGAYNWKVLDVQEDRALLFVEQMVGIKKFNKKAATWQKCSLRKYLNGAFLNSSFRTNERALILETTVKNYDGCVLGRGPGLNKSKPLPDTIDKIFLLSLEEVQKYIPKGQRSLSVGPKYIIWWLRETNVGDSLGQNACTMEFGGVARNSLCSMDYGVRPAMWVKIK